MQKSKCKVKSVKLTNTSSFCNLLFAICILQYLLISGCVSLPRIVIVEDPLSAKEHADLSAIYEEKGEYDLAIKEGEEALKQEPKNLKALISLGNSRLQKKEYKEAERYYKKALKIDAKNGDLLNNMAMLYFEIGRIEEAEGLAKEAISTNSPHLGYYYDTLGKVYEKMEKGEEASQAFDKAKELTK